MAFPGLGGEFPQVESTLGAVRKSGGYNTLFTGKWYLGEAGHALPNPRCFDVMEHCFHDHCNGVTDGDPAWFLDMARR